MVPISCRTNQGVSHVTSVLGDMVKGIVHSDSIKGDIGVITRERQRNCLTVAEEGLVDLEAEELRNGLKALARLTGDVDIEEVLDIVFSDFCIGK